MVGCKDYVLVVCLVLRVLKRGEDMGVCIIIVVFDVMVVYNSFLEEEVFIGDRVEVFDVCFFFLF